MNEIETRVDALVAGAVKEREVHDRRCHRAVIPFTRLEGCDCDLCRALEAILPRRAGEVTCECGELGARPGEPCPNCDRVQAGQAMKPIEYYRGILKPEPCSRCGGTRRVRSALGGVANAIEGPCPECGPVVAPAVVAKTFAIFEGMRHGIKRYAWWKDGTQYVGSCGRTLKDALADIDLEEDAAIAELQGTPG